MKSTCEIRVVIVLLVFKREVVVVGVEVVVVVGSGDLVSSVSRPCDDRVAADGKAVVAKDFGCVHTTTVIFKSTVSLRVIGYGRI